MKYLISIICLITIFACAQKDPCPTCCHGCGIDTTDKIYSFNIKGQLLNDCSGIPSANKKIQGFLIKQLDTITLQTITLGEEGRFEFTYQDAFEWGQAVAPWTTSAFAIRVLEDSILYLLPATINFSDLKLYLNDSIHCKINIDTDTASQAFTDTDKLTYYFEHLASGYGFDDFFNYKENHLVASGPFSHKTIILNERLRIITINESGMPVYFVGWTYKVPAPDNYTTDSININRQPCSAGMDSISIVLKK